MAEQQLIVPSPQKAVDTSAAVAMTFMSYSKQTNKKESMFSWSGKDSYTVLKIGSLSSSFVIKEGFHLKANENRLVW